MSNALFSERAAGAEAKDEVWGTGDDVRGRTRLQKCRRNLRLILLAVMYQNIQCASQFEPKSLNTFSSDRPACIDTSLLQHAPPPPPPLVACVMLDLSPSSF